MDSTRVEANASPGRSDTGTQLHRERARPRPRIRRWYEVEWALATTASALGTARCASTARVPYPLGQVADLHARPPLVEQRSISIFDIDLGVVALLG
jgi:hypothetical protein